MNFASYNRMIYDLTSAITSGLILLGACLKGRYQGLIGSDAQLTFYQDQAFHNTAKQNNLYFPSTQILTLVFNQDAI
jgi:hypothetical protein